MPPRTRENKAELNGKGLVIWNALKRTECRTGDITPPWLNALARFH